MRERREDSRHAALRAHWQDRASRNFLLVFQAQPILALLLSVPLWFIANQGGPEAELGLLPPQWVGAGWFLLAKSLGVIADGH